MRNASVVGATVLWSRTTKEWSGMDSRSGLTPLRICRITSVAERRNAHCPTKCCVSRSDSRHATGSLGHRVIILTRCETRDFPIFEQNAQNAKRTFEMLKIDDKSHCRVSVAGLKSLDVSPCNELLLLPMIIKHSLAWEYFLVTSMTSSHTPTHKSTFGVHYRTGSPGQLGLPVCRNLTATQHEFA